MVAGRLYQLPFSLSFPRRFFCRTSLEPLCLLTLHSRCCKFYIQIPAHLLLALQTPSSTCFGFLGVFDIILTIKFCPNITCLSTFQTSNTRRRFCNFTHYLVKSLCSPNRFLPCKKGSLGHWTKYSLEKQNEKRPTKSHTRCV